MSKVKIKLMCSLIPQYFELTTDSDVPMCCCEVNKFLSWITTHSSTECLSHLTSKQLRKEPIKCMMVLQAMPLEVAIYSSMAIYYSYNHSARDIVIIIIINRVQHPLAHHIIVDTPLNRCGVHFVDPEEFSVNDSWFVSMLTEIDCPCHRGYESSLHCDDIVQIVFKLRTNGGAD